MKSIATLLLVTFATVSCLAQTSKIESDSLLANLQSKTKNDWNLKLSKDTLSIESKNDSWIDFYNSAGAPMDDPQLNKFTDEYLQKNGKKTKMKIVFRVEDKWDSVKIKNVLAENKKIQTQADSLIYKYKLSHLQRTYRYNEELIWGATKDEEKRFEEYKKEKADLLKKVSPLPTYSSSKYSLFIVSRTWVFSEDNYYMLPKIYPQSEDAKTHELENMLDSTLKR